MREKRAEISHERPGSRVSYMMTHHPTLIVVWLVFVACVTVGYLVAVLGPWAPSWPRGGFGK